MSYCLMSLEFLGGTLGLFTGMSILSMIEVVYWALKFVANLHLWNINRKNKRPTQ